MGGEPGGPTQDAGSPGQPGLRKEVGSAASSQKHPPYVPEQEEDAPVQASAPSPEPVPTQAANAHGQDKADATPQPAIREGSMYEQRPGEDKDTPPSTTGGQ